MCLCVYVVFNRRLHECAIVFMSYVTEKLNIVLSLRVSFNFIDNIEVKAVLIIILAKADNITTGYILDS